MDIFVIAGSVSTTLFALANLPMLAKAARTHDLASYSPTNLVIGNLANVIHTFYIASLPVGPIWLLHGFYLVAMAMMLVLYVRYGRPLRAPAAGSVRRSTLEHARRRGADRSRSASL